MKKCQTVKVMSIDGNKTQKDIDSTNDEHKIHLSNKRLIVPVHHPADNSKILLAKKNNNYFFTNDKNSISNISLSINSNNIINDSNNSYKSKIYQKKRIPAPKKENSSKGKETIYSLSNKKNFINNKKKLNINNLTLNEKNNDSNSKDIKDQANSNYNKKYKNNISLNNNIIKRKKMKKYLYLNQDKNKLNCNEIINTFLTERKTEKEQKRKNSISNYKKIDLYKVNKINNININFNNINSKIEYNKIKQYPNSYRNNNHKDINLWKKLNFDQPEKFNFSELIDEFSSKPSLNNQNDISDRIVHNNKNYIYKNSYTLNADTNNNISTNSNGIKFHKKILYKIKPKVFNPIILTPRDKKLFSPRINDKQKNIKKIHNTKTKKGNPQKSDLLSSNKKDNNQSDNINRINIFVNNGNDKFSQRNKNINININNNFDNKIVTNESLTILNNSDPDIQSYLDNNDITQIESEKDENNNVVSSYQLNLYLNEAKNSKNIKINNISNKPINKALEYIQNANKYNTEVSNNKNINKTVDIFPNDNYQKNYGNKNSIYDYNTLTFIPFSKKINLSNILFTSINTNFKITLLKFLDKKSLVILSSINKNFHNKLRTKIYKYFYEKIIKNIGNREFMLKIFNTIPKYSSKILKVNNMKNLKSKYEYYKKMKSKYNDIILQDISRTFPNDESFKVDSINYKKLYNILISYSNYNKNIGYAQGLNFLVACSIFLFKNEEKVFVFLDGLINRFKLNHLLSINNQNLPKKLKKFTIILNKYCKDFIDYLSSRELNHEFFSTGWLLTLFSNSMERNKLFICWCFMIIFGWKFFYSFSIELLRFYKNSLLEINESKLSSRMKELLKGKQFIKDFNEIIKKTLIFMSNNIII